MESVNLISPIYNPYKINYWNLNSDWQPVRIRESTVYSPNTSLIHSDSNLMDLPRVKALRISWKEPTAGTAWRAVWMCTAHKTGDLNLMLSSAILFVLPKLGCFFRFVQVSWKSQFKPLKNDVHLKVELSMKIILPRHFDPWRWDHYVTTARREPISRAAVSYPRRMNRNRVYTATKHKK